MCFVLNPSLIEDDDDDNRVQLISVKQCKLAGSGDPKSWRHDRNFSPSSSLPVPVWVSIVYRVFHVSIASKYCRRSRRRRIILCMVWVDIVAHYQLYDDSIPMFPTQLPRNTKVCRPLKLHCRAQKNLYLPTFHIAMGLITRILENGNI